MEIIKNNSRVQYRSKMNLVCLIQATICNLTNTIYQSG